MKRILMLVLMGFATSLLFAQDVIYKNDGTVLQTKVLEITNESIKYKKFEQLDGPLRNIPLTDVFMIIYNDGTKEVFKNKSVPQTNENQNNELKVDHSKKNNIKENPNTYKSQNKEEKIPDIVFNFGIRAGYFMPSEDAIKEIYGNGVSFGSDINIWSKKGFGGGISIEYFGKKGDPYQYSSGLQIDNAESKISIIPIYLTSGYRIANNKKVIPYFGLGVGLFLFNEKVSATIYDPNTGENSYLSNEASETAFGFHIFSGIHLNNIIYFELEYSYGAIRGAGNGGAAGNDVNLGGLMISGGFKF